MTHDELMKVLSDFVRYYPLPADPLNNCERLNMFALLEDPTQVLDANMGKNVYEDSFFFSRAWDDAGQPADDVVMDTPSLTAVLYQTNPLNAFSQRPGMMVFHYDFLISDVLRDQKEDSGSSICDQRNENQILDQCARFCTSFFQYLYSLKKVTSASPPVGQNWGHSDLWEALEGQGLTVVSYDDPASNHFKKQLRQLNEDLTGQRWKAGNRVGINISLAIELDFCGDVVFRFNETPFKIDRGRILIKK